LAIKIPAYEKQSRHTRSLGKVKVGKGVKTAEFNVRAILMDTLSKISKHLRAMIGTLKVAVKRVLFSPPLNLSSVSVYNLFVIVAVWFSFKVDLTTIPFADK